MRIPRDTSLSEPIRLTTQAIPTRIAERKKELGALIQAALKVGADLGAREAGRRAYAELAKIDRDLQPAPAASVATSGQMLYAATKRSRQPAVL
jgi:hypothetical protein